MPELRVTHRQSLERRYTDRRSKTRETHQYSREQPPDAYMLPNLVKAHSGSSSSRSCHTHPEQDHSIMSPRRSAKKIQVGRHKHKKDNSIIRGAQILRQQLMILDDEDDYECNDKALKLGPIHESASGRHSHQQQHRRHDSPHRQHHKDVPQEDASTSSDDWSDPWNVSRRRAVPPVQEETQESDIEEQLITPRWQKREPPEEDDDKTQNEDQTAFTFDTKGDASKWAELSDGEDDADVTPEPMNLEDDEDLFATALVRRTPPPPPPPVPDGDTPESFMGRNRSLRTKVQTYIVQRVDEMDASTYASSYCQEASPSVAPGCSYLPNGLAVNTSTNTPGPKMAGPASPSGFPTLRQWDCNADSLDLLQELKNDEEVLRELETQGCRVHSLRQDKRDVSLPTVAVQQQAQEQDESSPCQHVVSPNSPLYLELIGDPAYLHAQRAGHVWQSLVSQHVRFPSKWWNGARGPPLGIGERRSWNYHGRHRIQANDVLNSLVHNRGSAGRILLHIVVRDLMTMQPVHDIAIGCFHPNARGIRSAGAFSPELEDCRDIWLAVRRRNDEFSVTETLLKKTSGHDDDADASPLGSNKSAVHNQNMRVVFGEQPPMQTLFVMESELYEILSKHKDGALPPAVVLMQQFLR
jgi:hypothetical protein